MESKKKEKGTDNLHLSPFSSFVKHSQSFKVVLLSLKVVLLSFKVVLLSVKVVLLSFR